MSISLRTLIDERQVNARVMALLQQRAVPAIIEAREKGKLGTLSENSFIFSSDCRKMEMVLPEAGHISEQEVVAQFGEVLLNAIIASPHHPKRLIAIARQCISGEITRLDDLDLRLERRLANTIYIPLIAIILALLLLLHSLSH
ncbi:MAG: hypothetical protein ACI30R_07115 [Sodaliphilus sp.]